MDNEEEREKERIGRKLKALDRESGRLIDAYQAEVIDLSELKERRERIEEHGRMLKRRLSEIHEKRADREQEIRLLEGLEQFSESVRDSLEEPSFETKQQVLRLVVDRIVVEDDKVVIHHVVPTGPVRLQTRHLRRHWAFIVFRSEALRFALSSPGTGSCTELLGAGIPYPTRRQPIH